MSVLIHKTGQGVQPIKAMGDGHIGGYLIVWGSPSNRDLQGEYFTPQTDLRLEYFDSYPVLYHHGLDETTGLKMIGRITSLKTDDIGLWVDAQLDLVDRYASEVYKMIQAKQFGWSSGSVDHLVKVEKTGEIKRWPLYEGSITPTPALPHKTTVRAFKAIVGESTLRGLLAANAGVSAGEEEKDDTGSNIQGVKSVKTNVKTRNFVRRVLKQYGYKADEEDVEAIAADLEDEAMMADDEFDEEAMMADFEEEEPIMADDEFDEEAMMADDEFDEEAMMADFEEEEPIMADDEFDEEAMMADFEEEEPVMTYRRSKKTSRRQRPAPRPTKRRQERTKSVADPYIDYLENRLQTQQARIKKLENMEAPGEKKRGIKGVQVTRDSADQPGAYKAAFVEYIRKGEHRVEPEVMRILRQGETLLGEADTKLVTSIKGVQRVKTMTIGDAGSLGFAVPEDFIRELSKNIMAATYMAQDCKVRTTSSDTIKQPYLPTTDARRAYAAQARWPGESPASQSEHDVTALSLEQIEIPIHVLLMSTTATYSSLEDVSFDVEAELSEMFAEATAVEYDTLIWSGNGQGKMKGIINDTRITGSASAGVQTVGGYIASGNATTLTDADKVLDMMMHMPAQYRGRAKWYMNSNTANVIEKLKDANGRYLWGDEQGLNLSTPANLKQRPIVYNEFASDIAANAFPLIYADLSRGYLIGKRVDMAVRRFDDSKYAELDQCLFMARARIGGQPVRPEAFKILKIALS
jgi:HK97 family phage major capsid protein